MTLINDFITSFYILFLEYTAAAYACQSFFEYSSIKNTLIPELRVYQVIT